MKNLNKYYKLIAKENQFIKNNINVYSSLTTRERELIGMLASGYSSSKIAVLMCVKECTVKRYQRNVRKKLLELKDDLPRFTEVFELDE
ncbi:MAG: helix-turn-helix transcriptional regulator [Bacteroidota bacterium]